MDIEQDVIKSIAKTIPDGVKTLREAYRESSELMKIKASMPNEFKVIEKLEGHISHESQHAGGIVIYPNLSDYLPIKTVGANREERIIAFDMDTIHELDFYKFDVLGLKTIEIIKIALDDIKNNYGIDLDVYSVDYDDENIYKMLSRGDLSGIFQISNQIDKVTRQRPKNFVDLIAINALIRPGISDFEEYIARRNGKEWHTHPDRMSYMKETEGLMAYQEQFLLDAKTFAGWDIAYADNHIRKNKDIKNDEELHRKFILDSSDRGYLIDDMEVIWNDIINSAGSYSFNKSHSASYAMTSFITAYLKYYYPKEFYSAMMSIEGEGTDEQLTISNYINELKEKGINVLPPDINISEDRFIPTKDGIRFKINVVRHLGESASKALSKMLPIKSFDDFMERREKKYMKKNTVVNLIKSGCFDFDTDNRAELLWRFDMSERTKTQIKEDYQCSKYEYNDNNKAMWEKESLGMYLSTHPLEKYGFKPLSYFKDGSYAMQGGEVSDLKIFNDKNNKEMAFVTIDTLYGNVKTIIFQSMWNDLDKRPLFNIGDVVMVKGKKSGNDILVNEMEILE